MFNPKAKIINCNTCGDITEQEIINGKTIKNCKRCRELNNNKKKQNKNNEPQIKYEAKTPEGFYKSGSVLYLDNVKEQEAEQDSTITEEQAEEEEETEEQQKQRRQEEHEQKLKQAREEQEAEYKRILKEKEEQQKAEEQQEQPKEKSIKELLQEINIKLNKPDTTNNNINTQGEITIILNNLFKQMDETHEYILLSHRERKEDHEQINEFIKQQELNNNIIINKLDNILKAIT